MNCINHSIMHFASAREPLAPCRLFFAVIFWHVIYTIYQNVTICTSFLGTAFDHHSNFAVSLVIHLFLEMQSCLALIKPLSKLLKPESFLLSILKQWKRFKWF